MRDELLEKRPPKKGIDYDYAPEQVQVFPEAMGTLTPEKLEKLEKSDKKILKLIKKSDAIQNEYYDDMEKLYDGRDFERPAFEETLRDNVGSIPGSVEETEG